MIKEGEIILINGTSCSGKTSLAREIQRLAPRPYIATGHDDFMPMFPGRYVGIDKRTQPSIASWPEPGNVFSSLGFEVVVEPSGSVSGSTPDRMSHLPPRFHLTCGPVGWQLLSGMHRAFATMARAGCSLVVADVISPVVLYDYCAALKGLRRVYLVGLHCPVEVLEQREAQHNNRTVGGARMQAEKVHEPGEYDLTLDTGSLSTEACARQVLEHIKQHPPRVFEGLVARYGDFEVQRYPVEIW